MSGLGMDGHAMIKTWEQRCEEHPAHQTGMVSHAMIQARMQEEIDELRYYIDGTKQEFVAWRVFDCEGDHHYVTYEDNEDYERAFIEEHPQDANWIERLYTAPPQRKPLTEQEICENLGLGKVDVEFVRMVERAHGIE